MVEPGTAPVKIKVIRTSQVPRTDQQYRPAGFKAMMGAEAIKELLKCDIEGLSGELREKMKHETRCRSGSYGT